MNTQSIYHLMYMIALMLVQMFLVSFPQDLSARIIEDGEDGTTNKWTVYDSLPAGAFITNIPETSSNNSYIELSGTGAANAYLVGNFSGLPGSFQEATLKTLNLKFRPNGYYAFYVAAMTTNGARYLYYDSQSANQGLIWDKYIHVGLGPVSDSTEWTSFSQNLSDDLEASEPGNTIITIDGIIIRGDMDIDDIEFDSVNQSIDITPPVITVLGNNVVNIYLGDPYSDGGATALDDVDGSVLVTTTGNVNSSLLGQYTITYTATDQANNTASATRTVNVNQPPNSTPSNICSQDISDLNWSVYDDSPSGAEITFGTNESNGIAILNGTGAANAYLSGGFGPTTSGWGISGSAESFSVDVQRNGYLAIFVVVLTDNGYRYLYYDTTSTNQGLIWGKYIHNGLGSALVDGNWSTVNRDVQTDLSRVEPGNGINSIEGIIFRGSTTVRNICFSDGSSSTDNTNPVVTLNGNSTLDIQIGQTYLELGATAMDETDGSLSVTVAGSVNTSVPGTYSLVYTATDNSGNSGTATRTVNVINTPTDTLDPVVTINGDATITVQIGQTYSEQSATALDETDGVLPVTITGSVDTSISGTYTITYSATDNAGNTGSATRTINIVNAPSDTTNPVVTLIGSDPIEIEIGQIYTEIGATALDDTDGVLTVGITGSVDTSTIGTYTITYSATDNSGNTGTATRTVEVVQTVSSSTIIENGESGVSTDWWIFDDSPDGASITTVFSTEQNSNVISLQGAGASNAYMHGSNPGLPRAWGITNHTVLSWKSKANSALLIFVSVNTSNGHRYIYYNNKATSDGLIWGKYIHIGVGQQLDNSQWTSFARDISSDIQSNEPGNSLVSIDGIIFRGSAEVDNITTHTSINDLDIQPPNLVLNDPIYYRTLQYSTYIDPGYVVTDNEDTSVEVSVSGSVNTSVTGEYVLVYTAIDSSGNEISKSRTVKIEPDSIAPFIDLVEGHYIYVDADTTFIDPGYTVHDNLGENPAVTVTGSVDTSKPGAYVLTYSTTDNFGNTFSTTRNVYVEPVGSIIYEDGSSNLTTTWSITDNTPPGAVIQNVYDNDVMSDVVYLCGSGLQNSFSLYTEDIFWENSRANQISWDGKFDGHFSMFVYIETLYGPRYAYYTTVPGTDGLIWSKYIRKTINAPPTNNTWQSYARDIQNDIKDHEPGNSLESVEFISIRGCGYIDNIALNYDQSHIEIEDINHHVHTSMNIGESVFKPVVHHDIANKISTYSITGSGSEYFSIDNDGNLTLASPIPDRAEISNFSFTGSAMDELGVSHNYSINLENLEPIELSNTTINSDIIQSNGNTAFNLNSNSIYLFQDEINLQSAGNIQFVGDNTVFLRSPSSFTTTTSDENYYGESYVSVLSVPDSFNIGDRIAMSQDGGINHQSISESRFITNIVNNDIYLDNPFTKYYSVGANVFKDYNFIRGLPSEQEDGYNPNISISGIHFDGNSRNNKINHSWTVNSSILLHGGMTSSIIGNIFSDSPNETIVGHGTAITLNTFERLNGSAAHYSVHDNSSIHSGGSLFSYNTVSLPNIIEQGNALNGHSEGAITFSWGGGDLEVSNNIFEGSNEYFGVLGLFVGADINNDENLLVTNNVAENFRYIIKIVSPPANPANNILITGNDFIATGYNDFTHLSQQQDIRLGCNNLSGGTVMVLSGFSSTCN